MGLIVPLLIAAHVLMVGLSIPMIRRRVPPNPTYGFRTPQTLADERVWYEANAASGRFLFVASVVSAVLSLLCVLTVSAPTSYLLASGVMVTAVSIAALASFAALRRIVR